MLEYVGVLIASTVVINMKGKFFFFNYDNSLGMGSNLGTWYLKSSPGELLVSLNTFMDGVCMCLAPTGTWKKKKKLGIRFHIDHCTHLTIKKFPIEKYANYWVYFHFQLHGWSKEHVLFKVINALKITRYMNN